MNAVAHIGEAVALGRYNSGVVTAALLFVPVCAVALVRLRRLGVIRGLGVLRVVATGIGVHALLIASLLARRSGWIGEGALITINLAYGVLPLALGSIGV